MKKISLVWILLFLAFLLGDQMKPWTERIKTLSPEEKHVIVDKGTEMPFSGEYVSTTQEGIYTCKVCGQPLYVSKDKFNSHCGWPSFDDAIPGAVKEQTDADGRRTEIVCAKCGAHLGHVFRGEGFTPKNTRHCVNSISLQFEAKKDNFDKVLQKAYFAGGCFWGVEYYLEKLNGVKEVTSGYMGGAIEAPTYEQVSAGQTGHLEAVEVVYDPKIITYEALAKTFFEIHDPTQIDGQGPDIGEQYRSAVFVGNQKEREVIENLIGLLEKKGFKVATKVLDIKPFYKAEAYHQNYYRQKEKTPYCHGYVKRFD